MAINSNAQEWLDTAEYPFEHHFLQTKNGKLHYIDEGKGEVLLFIHGTPTWSFLYRNYIKAFSNQYRCIALDHLGFGLSDKPIDFIGTPEAHAANLEALIDTLGLTNITLVVHDFGGPIGLSYAIKHASNISRVVIFNTWLWGTKDDPDAQKIYRILHSALGNFLYLRTNLSPKILLKKAFHDKKKLNRQVHRQYTKPFPNKTKRYGLLKIGQSLIGSSDWYQQQWESIDTLKNIPFLILWGEKDDFIKKTNLEKWKAKLTNETICVFPSGHFVQEESFDESLERMKHWLNQNK